MVPWIHLTSFAVAAVAAGLLWSRVRVRVTAARILFGAGAFVVVALVGMTLGLHRCAMGQPLSQWLIPSMLAAIVVATVGHPAARRGYAMAMVGLTAVLSLHYSAVVHGPTYVGRRHASPGAGAGLAAWHTPITGLYRLQVDPGAP